jgi:hypothetical protein
MATSVNGAFDEFLRGTVNLDPGQTSRARDSRDWLVSRLRELHQSHADFPLPYEEIDVSFGSFARRTKIRELDDIDVVSCMRAEGASYLDMGDALHITVPENCRLRDMCDDGGDQLNSKKVINRFVRCLKSVPQYARSELSRRGESAVLNLASYPWSFDIVPGFFTVADQDGRTFYVIPNGQGLWMKTDPRIDQSRVKRVNQAHDGNVLDVVRLVKYWNRRPTMPSVPPYVLESIVLSHYESASSLATAYVDLEVGPVLGTIASAILQPVPDAKGIQGDLNNLPFDQRVAISNRALGDAQVAQEARAAEVRGDHAESIRLWTRIFGAEFPKFG